MTASRRTLGELAAIQATFSEERGWARFHSPRNLATALAVEAAELLEPFQWTIDPHARVEPSVRESLAGELADIQIYLLALATKLNIDLGEAVEEKMRVNSERFPIGSNAVGPWTPRKRNG